MIKHKDNVKGLRAIDIAPTIAFLMDIPGPQNARGRILYDIVERRRAPAGGHDPRHQRLPRPADPARRGVRHASGPTLRHRRLGVPQDVVRDVRGRGGAERQARRRDRDGRRRLGRRDAADLELLRRHADDRDHEHDGDRPRRARQPQLRPRRRLTCGTQLIPLADFPFVSANVVDANGNDAAGVVAVARLQVPATASRSASSASRTTTSRRSRSPGALDPFHVGRLDRRGQRRGGEARQEGRRDRRDRPPGRNRRDAHRPDRAAGRPRRRRLERRRRDRRPHRPPGLTTRSNGVLVTENREQGHPLHAGPARDRPGQGGRRLQDGRLPQAVGHRRHARSRRSRRRSTT